MIGVGKEYKIEQEEDPLWGADFPKHYIENYSSTDLNKVWPYDGGVKQRSIPELLRYKP